MCIFGQNSYKSEFFSSFFLSFFCTLQKMLYICSTYIETMNQHLNTSWWRNLQLQKS